MAITFREFYKNKTGDKNVICYVVCYMESCTPEVIQDGTSVGAGGAGSLASTASEK